MFQLLLEGIDLPMLALLVTLTIVLVGLTFAFLGMQLIKMHNEIKRLTAAVGMEASEIREIKEQTAPQPDDEPEALSPPADTEFQPIAPEGPSE